VQPKLPQSACIPVRRYGNGNFPITFLLYSVNAKFSPKYTVNHAYFVRTESCCSGGESVAEWFLRGSPFSLAWVGKMWSFGGSVDIWEGSTVGTVKGVAVETE